MNEFVTIDLKKVSKTIIAALEDIVLEIGNESYPDKKSIEKAIDSIITYGNTEKYEGVVATAIAEELLRDVLSKEAVE